MTDGGAAGAGRNGARAGRVGGALASLAIVGLSAAIMASWSAGPGADLLLGIVALGLLFCIPANSALWAVLALLVCAAASLAAGDQALANGLGNLLYLALVAAGLWQVWALALERSRWRLPLAELVRGRWGRGAAADVPEGARWQ